MVSEHLVTKIREGSQPSNGWFLVKAICSTPSGLSLDACSTPGLPVIPSSWSCLEDKALEGTLGGTAAVDQPLCQENYFFRAQWIFDAVMVCQLPMSAVIISQRMGIQTLYCAP